MTTVATDYIRQPLKFEDRPVLYFIWKFCQNFFGAIESHYLRCYPFRGYGPPPSFYLRPSVLANTWICAKARVGGRFKKPPIIKKRIDTVQPIAKENTPSIALVKPCFTDEELNAAKELLRRCIDSPTPRWQSSWPDWHARPKSSRVFEWGLYLQETSQEFSFACIREAIGELAGEYRREAKKATFE